MEKFKLFEICDFFFVVFALFVFNLFTKSIENGYVMFEATLLWINNTLDCERVKHELIKFLQSVDIFIFIVICLVFRFSFFSSLSIPSLSFIQLFIHSFIHPFRSTIHNSRSTTSVESSKRMKRDKRSMHMKMKIAVHHTHTQTQAHAPGNPNHIITHRLSIIFNYKINFSQWNSIRFLRF